LQIIGQDEFWVIIIVPNIDPVDFSWKGVNPGMQRQPIPLPLVMLIDSNEVIYSSGPKATTFQS
jgi:hypothetical protein